MWCPVYYVESTRKREQRLRGMSVLPSRQTLAMHTCRNCDTAVQGNAEMYPGYPSNAHEWSMVQRKGQGVAEPDEVRLITSAASPLRLGSAAWAGHP